MGNLPIISTAPTANHARELRFAINIPARLRMLRYPWNGGIEPWLPFANINFTRLAAAVCCLCCGIIPVFIPFVCNWCSDLDHHCENCHKRVAHQPHEGKMEAVLPPVSVATTGADSRYQSSQYADMSKQSQQKLEPTAA